MKLNKDCLGLTVDLKVPSMISDVYFLQKITSLHDSDVKDVLHPLMACLLDKLKSIKYL